MAHREPHPDPTAAAAARGQLSPEAHVQLRFEKFSSFVEEYWPKISLRGMLLETTQPKPVGTMISFEFKLTDGFRLCQGVGEVAWVRHHDEGPQRPAGMGIRFHALDDQGRELILKILEEQVKSGGEPFEIERVPPGAESESAQEFAGPPPPAEGAGWVRPPPKKVQQTPPPPAQPPEPAAAAAEAPAGGFQAPWEKLPEPSDVLDPLDDSSVSSTAEMEEDSDSGLAGFPLDPERPEPELPESDDDEPLLMFVDDEPEEGEALASSEAVAEREEIDAFDAEASVPELSFDLGKPVPEFEAPVELIRDESAVADLLGVPSPEDAGKEPEDAGKEPEDAGKEPEDAGEEPGDASEEPTILLSKIAELSREEAPPSLDAEAEIQFDAESSAAFLELDTSADEPTLPPPLVADAEEEMFEVPEASPFDGLGDDASALLGSQPEDVPDEGLALLPEPELPPLEGIDVAPSPPLLPEPEPDLFPPFPEVGMAPEPEAPEPFPEVEIPPEPEAPEPFPEVEIPPEPEAPEPFPEVEIPPEPEASPAPEEADLTATPVAAASSFLDLTAGRLPDEDISEEDEGAWEEEGESGPRLFLRDLRLAIAESWVRIAVVVVVLAVAGAGYYWYDEILQIAGLSSPATIEVTEAPLASAPEGPEPGGEEQPLPGESVDTGPEVRVVEPQLAESPPATPAPARETPRRETAPRAQPVGAAARTVTRISHDQTAAGTLVTILLDGNLAADRYQHSELGYDPLKEQLTIHGIEAPYRSLVAVGTRELQQIRLGYHPGNELKLVFDLGSGEMSVAEIRNRGDRLEVLVSSR